MVKQIKIIMLLACTIMLVLLNLDYNPFNHMFINNVMLMVLSMCFIKAYDVIDE
jgi:hypothetical protein